MSVTSKEIANMKSTKDAIKTILKHDQPVSLNNVKKGVSDYYEMKKVSHKNGHSIFEKKAADLSVRSKLASSKNSNQKKEKSALKHLQIATSRHKGKPDMTSRPQNLKIEKAKRESLHELHKEHSKKQHTSVNIR